MALLLSHKFMILKIIKMFKRKEIEENMRKFIVYNEWKGQCYKTGIKSSCPIPGLDTTPLWIGYQDMNFLRYYNVNEDLIKDELFSIENAKDLYHRFQKIRDLKSKRDSVLSELNEIEEEISQYTLKGKIK